MNKEERIAWLAKLRLQIETLADQTFQLEQSGKRGTEQYKTSFLKFQKQLKLYEEASNKHERLLEEEKN